MAVALKFRTDGDESDFGLTASLSGYAGASKKSRESIHTDVCAFIAANRGTAELNIVDAQKFGDTCSLNQRMIGRWLSHLGLSADFTRTVDVDGTGNVTRLKLGVV
jgi:hypothetical protein